MIVLLSDSARSILICSLIVSLVSFVARACIVCIKELRRTSKQHKYKNMFAEIIVDDGYGDIHRTIYPNEILSLKLFTLVAGNRELFNDALQRYIHNALSYAKVQRRPKKRRKYELITTLNVMYLIKKEDY